MPASYKFTPPGAGVSYDWSNDNIFVKVDTEDSDGAYTIVEDNLKASFALGLHMHRNHAETFYILEGSVDFYVDDQWIKAEKGACLHVPAGIPHAAKVTDGQESARMLMVFQPAGFDGFLKEMAGFSEADFADEARMAALNEQYDIVPLGPVPESS
ncbi:MAG: cupin domain-containing protein [Rhizobiaceae bacterium]